ncbi:sugar transferase [Phototrophicus methaneseepsis]|uniref:Sugar transferase n=1 Tax=Phototrophicus methaneseepsis TaxID=2710758 RepID=A0A7S8ECI8_9CHLR|nr:sugar transferase [Phototrophicus methaneseepsis]QPC84452.1 sugar transferase [Phototrophicus methaneseepsis]
MSTNTTTPESKRIEPRWLFPLIDAILVVISFALAYLLRYELQLIRPVLDPFRREFTPYLPYALLLALILYINYSNNGLYRNVRERTWLEEVTLIGNGVAFGTVILLAVFFVFQPLVTSRLMLIYVAAISVAMLSLARLVRRWVLAYLRNKGIGVQRVLIVGMGDTGQAVLRAILARTELGYKVVGYLDDNPRKGDVDIGRVPGLGNTRNLRAAIRTHGVDIVISTLRWKHYDLILETARICRQTGVEVRLVPDIFQLNMRQVQVETLDGIPLLGISGPESFRGADRLVKRALDIIIVVLTSVAWVPVFLVTALAVKLDSSGPVIYRQQRIGENGREFSMYKFRTMVTNADELRDQIIEQHQLDPRHPKIPDDPRITKVGKFLRRLSLDELPNLINVLRGEMSMVGPRPPMPDEVALYEPWHRQRLNIIPGITGLWQVSGRSEVPFDEMCLLDIYYIENWSLKMDIQILLRTIPRVLLRSGAY